MKKINQVFKEMLNYYSGDSKRIQHFIKVHSFSKIIGELEGIGSGEQYILEIAALVHDIGIKKAEEKYGSCDGKLQEKEGPSIAREMLEGLEVEETVINRVCYLVGHHHTYSNIEGIDYQILVEADFLVNLHEDENITQDSRKSVYNKIFKTKSSKEIFEKMFK